MQLMKLVYKAHGGSFAIRKADLFGSCIEAWKYGRVIPDLYFATRKWGRNPIPLDMVTDGIEVDKQTEDFLRDVFGKYGHIDGIALSHMTHKPSTPWSQVYKEGLNAEIPDTLIATHYRQLLNDRSELPPPTDQEKSPPGWADNSMSKREEANWDDIDKLQGVKANNDILWHKCYGVVVVF